MAKGPESDSCSESEGKITTRDSIRKLIRTSIPSSSIIGGDDSDNNLLGIVRRAKRSIREIIANIVNLIFGTVGSAANAIVDAFGLDALLGSDGERSSSSSRRSY